MELESWLEFVTLPEVYVTAEGRLLAAELGPVAVLRVVGKDLNEIVVVEI